MRMKINFIIYRFILTIGFNLTLIFPLIIIIVRTFVRKLKPFFIILCFYCQRQGSLIVCAFQSGMRLSIVISIRKIELIRINYRDKLPFKIFFHPGAIKRLEMRFLFL